MFQGMSWELLIATGETLYMTLLAGFFAIFFGLPLGIFLFLSRKQQLLDHACLHQMLSFIVNVGRSIPFVILMIAVIPFTRWIVGTSIGTNAAIVPLAIAAIPFFARMVETSLAEIPVGLVEAALAMGATTRQIVVKVLLPEARSSLIYHTTTLFIALVGYSAMAGAVGGGGLGDLAVRYGYQRFDMPVMLETIIILLLLVQTIQWIGNCCARFKSQPKL